MSLSRRADVLTIADDRFLFWKILQDLWHPESNSTGFVNLGVAENYLMHDVLSERIHQRFSVPDQAFTYGDGAKRLKSAISLFMNKHFLPVTTIVPNHVIVTNGCSSAIEHLAWAFANPGDCFLLGRPYYGTFLPDLTLRTGAHVIPIAFDEIDPVSVESVEKYERAILKCQSENRKVAGLILSHPHNPLGRCYPRAALIEFMKLCQKYSIHLISDEIYALSVFSNEVDSTPSTTASESCLSIPTEGIIDPSLLHVVWGMSKDFGANGLRVGAIISQKNQNLHQALVPALLYSSVSSLSEHAASDVLEDEAWTTNYILENQRRLKTNFERVTSWAKEHNIAYTPGVNAAFFLWLDLATAYRQCHNDVSGDITEVVMQALLKRKVFLASGAQFGSEDAGWFRIIFSQRTEQLEEGLKRILDSLHD